MVFRFFTILILCFFASLNFAQLTSTLLMDQEGPKTIFVNEEAIIRQLKEDRNSTIHLPYKLIGEPSFTFSSYDILDKSFQKQRPDIKIYTIVSTSNANINGTLMITQNGIYSTITTPNGLTSIYPKEGKYKLEQGIHNEDNSKPTCQHNNLNQELKDWKSITPTNTSRFEIENGNQIRRYRLAAVTTGEFYELNGNNDSEVQDVLTATVLGINVIYKNELSVEFSLLTPFLYKDKNTDPFVPHATENRPDEASKGVNQAFPDATSYDIGHAFHKSEEDDGWASGGIARLSSVCNSTIQNGGPLKAKGWSGSFNTLGNSFISLSAHEFAHMFSATHTFNGDGGFNDSATCDDAHTPSSAYEIGSGTTIMSYNGLCDNEQNISSSGAADNYFHVHSISQILSFINSSATCHKTTFTSNTPPTAEANACGGQIVIPKNTPFLLKGKATDTENNGLTYTWEQYDKGDNTMGLIGSEAATSTSAPLFRSFPPSPEIMRYFPRLETLANGATSNPFEVLPSIGRTLNFQFTVRDNSIVSGGIATDNVSVRVINVGPLTVQDVQNTTAGSKFDFNWEPNGSDDLCDKVVVKLSIDGGKTYPYIIKEDIDYHTGNAEIFIPPTTPDTRNARLMLTCADNDCYSFFDITDNPFEIASICTPTKTVLCNNEYEEFEKGDPALDLDLKLIEGQIHSKLDITVNITDNQGPFTMYNATQTGCFEMAFNTFSKIIPFNVTKDGSYRFDVEGGGVISIFKADGFTQNSPCNGDNFVGSNSTSTGSTTWNYRNPFDVELSACTDYLIYCVINTNDFPAIANINSITGPGDVILENETSNSNFATTFIAVTDDGIIETVSENANFVNLSGGLYQIYGVSFKASGTTPPENTDPSDWIGSTLTSLQASECFVLSTNSKEILVDYTCKIQSIEVGTQTLCDSFSNTYSQELIITYEEAPTTGSLIVNGTPFTIETSPQTILLTAQISDGKAVGVSASFSVTPNCSRFIENLFIAPENCCDIDVNLGEDQYVCSGEPILLDAGEGAAQYTWFANSTPSTNMGSTFSVSESGNYLVEVKNEVGCSKFDDVSITIFATPEVNIPEDTTVCEGEIFLLSAQTNADQFQWYKNDILVSNDTTSSILVTEADAYVLQAEKLYSLQNGISKSCVAYDTSIVNHTNPPIINLGDDINVCSSDVPIILNAQGNATNYIWIKNDIELANSENPTYQAQENGQYIVTASKVSGCSSMDTINIAIFENATVSTSADFNLCDGNEVQLNATIDATSYQWLKDGQLFADQSVQPMITEGGTYVLVGENEIGCQVMDTTIVTIVSPPIVDLGEDRVTCIGSTIQLTVDSVGIISWTKDGDLISQNASIEIDKAGEYIVSVEASMDCISFDTISVMFEQGPTLDLGGDRSFCRGTTVDIRAETNATSITWFYNNQEIIGATGFSLPADLSGEFNAIVEGDTGCTVEETITITVFDLPIVDLGEDVIVCNGTYAEFSPDVEGTSFTWLKNGEIVGTNRELSTIEAGQYVLTVENENNCTSSDTVNVLVNGYPVIALQDSFTICGSGEITIEAISDASSYQWVVNGTTVIGETSNTLTVNEQAKVQIIATNEEGCATTDSTNVYQYELPIVDLGENTALCPNQSLTLDAGPQTTYLWSNGSTTQKTDISSINVQDLYTENYSVTVTNNDGCYAVDSVEITFFPPIQGTVELSASGLCGGEPVTLTASGGLFYTWVVDTEMTLDTFAGPVVTASPTRTTTYEVLITDECPDNEDVVIVEVEIYTKGDDVSAGEDDCAVNGKPVTLQATGGESYQWVDDPTILNGVNTPTPEVLPTVETTYYVDITDSYGCIYRDEVTICITDDPLENFKLVTIITPNQDGQNDYLRFEGLDSFPENTLKIYNRWGYLVYSKSGYQADDERWNGENGGDILNADTYYYILSFNDEVYKSTITIMR